MELKNIERINPTEDMLSLHQILHNAFPFSTEGEVDVKMKELLDAIVVELANYYRTGVDRTERRVMDSFVDEELHTLGTPGITLVINMVTLITEDLGIILMSTIMHDNIRVVAFDRGTLTLGRYLEQETKMYL